MLNNRNGFKNILPLLLKKGKITFPNGFSITVNKENFRDVLALYLFSIKYGVNIGDEWKVNEEHYTIATPDGIKFSLRGFDHIIFAETFLYDTHFTDFDLNGRIVIHAGAYVGETALYYAKKGAYVYAFEPQLDCYEIAKHNLELNPDLAKKVTLKNWAIGHDDDLEFPSIECNGDMSLFKESSKKMRIRSVSISTILKEFNILNPDILDLDIKGAEFYVINDKSLEKFRVIRIEYETLINGKKVGDPNYLIDKLKSYGFNKIRIYKHNELPFPLSVNGTIVAYK
ncbi:FkbM family methyltransferase [Saccharolobus islandicus]|nr:FkbM family methyltransferase [Sulfolobus islandicus]